MELALGKVKNCPYPDDEIKALKRDTVEVMRRGGNSVSRASQDRADIPIDYRNLDALLRAAEDPVVSLGSFCDELLSEKNFMLDKEVGGNKVVKPEWTLCVGYELELRKEAIRLVREQSMSIQQAMWTAYRDQQHRLEN